MRYYDIHTHRLPPHPEDTAIVSVSVGAGQNLSGQAICDKEPDHMPLFLSYGIHPWYIYNVREQMDELRRLAFLPQVLAIGEAGFDKWAVAPPEEQRSVFMSQVILSEEVGKPLIIHCVKAWAELIACRKEACPKQPWIIHGFRGNGELAGQLVRLGFGLSFGVRFQASAVRAAWPGALLVETDDSPADIRSVYQNVSRALSVTDLELANQIGRNVSIFAISK